MLYGWYGAKTERAILGITARETNLNSLHLMTGQYRMVVSHSWSAMHATYRTELVVSQP